MYGFSCWHRIRWNTNGSSDGGGGGEPGLNLQTTGKEARYHHALHASPEMSETDDEAFPQPRNAAKFGCDPRAASLKQTNH